MSATGAEILLLLFGVIYPASIVSVQVSEIILDYHNYGYTLTSQGELYLVAGTTNAAFVINLPEQQNVTVTAPFQCDQITTRGIGGGPTGAPTLSLCNHVKSVVQAFQSMRDDITRQVHERVGLLYSMLDSWQTDRQRAKRWNPLGAVISTITGLATESELEPIKHMLRQTEQMTLRAARTWRTGNNHFLSTLKVQNKRINNINRLLQLQKQSVQDLFSEVATMFTLTDNLSSAFAKSVLKLKNLIFRVAELQSLYDALQQLMAGKLPHFLVSHQALSHTLNNIGEFLAQNHPDLTVLHDGLHYYYREGHFSFLRQEHRLVIILNVPLTLKTTKFLTLYHVTPIPLPTPGAPGYISELVPTFESFAYHPDSHYYIIIAKRDSIPPNRHLVAGRTDVQLIKRSKMSCALALVTGRLALIKVHCSYQVARRQLIPSIYRLGEDKILLSNVSSAEVYCPKFHNRTSIAVTHVQMVLQLACDCAVETPYFYVPGLAQNCDVTQHNFTSILSPKFCINLAYLSHYFSESELQGFRADTTLNSKVDISLPKLPIDSQQYSQSLALEKEAKFEMTSLIRNVKTDNRMYDSLAHKLADTVLQNTTDNETFSVFSWLDWLIIVTAIIAMTALGWTFVLGLRLKAISALLATARATTANPVLPRRLNYLSATTVTSNLSAIPLIERWKTLTSEISNVISIEIMIASILVLIVIFWSGRRLYYIFRTPKRTILWLRLGDGIIEERVFVMSLNFPLNFYQFNVSKQPWRPLIYGSAVYTNLLWGRHLLEITVYDGIKTLQLPQLLRIGPWSSRRIKAILQKPHYYLVMEITDDSQQTRDLILLKDACPVGGEGSAGRAPEETSKSATDKALYPNLYTCA